MKIIDFLRTHAFKEGIQQRGKNYGKPLSTSSIMAIVTALCDLYNVCQIPVKHLEHLYHMK